MTSLLALVTILQSFSISLGVGASTLAIVNFFAAIADGKIDDTERRMMGIVYLVLKLAMMLIFATSVVLLSAEYATVGLAGLSVHSVSLFVVLLVLYVNALLMTAQLMPSTFGPAIQAGSWYTLGVIISLELLRLTDFTYEQFFLAYISWLILAVGTVNALMALMRQKLKKKLSL